jgi:hypothetical protein
LGFCSDEAPVGFWTQEGCVLIKVLCESLFCVDDEFGQSIMIMDEGQSRETSWKLFTNPSILDLCGGGDTWLISDGSADGQCEHERKRAGGRPQGLSLSADR